MQISAIKSNYGINPFKGINYRPVNEPIKEQSNEEVLKNAKARYQKRPPSFTPKQQAIFTDIELFKNTGIISEMKEFLSEADALVEKFRKSSKNKFDLDIDNKHYSYKKENLPDIHGYDISITVSDDNGDNIYTYKMKDRGGYSKHSVKSKYDDFGIVELTRDGIYGKSTIYVNNLEKEKYYFAGDFDHEGNLNVDYILNNY